MVSYLFLNDTRYFSTTASSNLNNRIETIGAGRYLAVKLVDLGLKVIALARSKDKLESLKKERPQIETIRIDISNFDDVREKIGPIAHNIDYLINNASYYIDDHVEQVDLKEFDTMFSTNVKAPLNFINLLVPGMKERRFGCIVNILGRGTKTHFYQPLYNCSKAALERVKTHTVNELSQYNIRVIDIDPGVADSEKCHEYLIHEEYNPENLCIPIRRYQSNEEISNTIIFGLSNAARAMNGSAIYVDGGFHAL